MARDGLLLFVCVCLLTGPAPGAVADSAADRENKVVTQLAVQRALREGRDQLQRGNFEAAVFALESQIARANGSSEYLAALCDAYRGYLVELRKAGRHSEMPKYQERLEILDPAAGLGRKGQPSVAAASPGPAPTAAGPPSFPAPRPIVTEGRQAAGATPPPGAVRAKLEEEDDPFSDANAKPQPAGTLARAEDEYAARHYEAAGRLYEQASRASEPLTDASREHWGYCKLVSVADTLRRPAGNAATTDLEREVRQAMSMTPKLDSFGKDLLRKLQDRQSVAVVDTPTPERPVEVRHTPAREGYCAIAETTNFRILHLQSREFAENIARTAEATRSAMIRKWFGDDTGPWNPRCDIFIYNTAQDYVQATGAPTNSPGHSTMRTEGERVLSRRIDLHADDPNMSVGVLPHETTHVVLAGRFGNHNVPRWADEGMAVLSEPRDRIERHLRNLPQHRADRHLFGTGQLMKLDAYPDPRYIGPFYAQSVSLVDYLAERGGPRVFAKFLRDGLDGGYEAALQKYYNVQGFAELEQQWMEHTFGATTAAGYGR